MTTRTSAALDVWEVLGALVAYPDVSPAVYLAARCGVPGLDTDVADALERFERAVADVPLTVLQERYSEAFDFGTACTLDVGWHLFGESRKRAQFLSRLVEDLSRAGIIRTTELPDHLTQVLSLVGRAEEDEARVLAALVLPAVEKIRRGLGARASVYAPLLEAVEAALSASSSHLPGVSFPGS